MSSLPFRLVLDRWTTFALLDFGIVESNLWKLLSEMIFDYRCKDDSHGPRDFFFAAWIGLWVPRFRERQENGSTGRSWTSDFMTHLDALCIIGDAEPVTITHEACPYRQYVRRQLPEYVDQFSTSISLKQLRAYEN